MLMVTSSQKPTDYSGRFSELLLSRTAEGHYRLAVMYGEEIFHRSI